MSSEPLAREARTRRTLRLAEVARVAGVTRAVAARALARDPRVAEAVRRNAPRTGVVGVVFPLAHERAQPLSDPFFLEMIGRLSDSLAARGCGVLLLREAAPVDGWLERLWRSGQADGLLVVGQSDQHAALNAAAGAEIPLVVWGALRPDQRYPTVGVDNVAGARAATRRLYAAGRRRIAFLGGGDAPEFVDRLLGYEAALTAARLPLDPALHLQTHISGDDLAAPLLRRMAETDIDAVVCASDVIAISVLEALRARGVRVPQDVAVTGFDDIAAAALTTPGLTTVRQDLAAGAGAMVDVLFRLKAGRSGESVVLPAPLVVRGSAP